MCIHPAAATVHSADDSAYALTRVTMHCSPLRHKNTLFSPCHFMPPYCGDTGSVMEWGAGNVFQDLVRCTWVITQHAGCAREEQNMHEMFPVGHRSRTAQIYPQASLFNGFLCVSSCCAVNISQETLPDITFAFTASAIASSYITCCWLTPSMRAVFWQLCQPAFFFIWLCCSAFDSSCGALWTSFFELSVDILACSFQF